MFNFIRLSKSPVVRWWWRLDRVMLSLILGLMLFGCIAVATASAGVAGGYKVGAYFFGLKQLGFVIFGLCVMLSVSTLSVERMKLVGFALFAAGVAGLVLTLGFGQEVKGAKRWLNLGFIDLQVSEFMKPAFAIVVAMVLSRRKEDGVTFQQIAWTVGLFGLVALLIALQPNFSMIIVFAVILAAQLLLAGLSFAWVLGLGGLAVSGAAAMYLVFPHVRSRVERHFDPTSGDTYQIDRAWDAVLSGGFTGRGLGEGVVKHYLPDAHTDFIFAVITEELGLLVGLGLLAVYGMLVMRAFSRILDSNDKFTLLAGSGMLCAFSFQVLVNMGVVLRVLPTTGMTLPFLSYGGSAVMTASLMMGFVLALCKKRASSGVSGE